MSCNIKALNYTQRIIQGDSFDKSYTGKDKDTVNNTEIPLNLSNKTVRGQIRKTPDDPSPIDFSTSTFDSGSGTVDSFRLFLTSGQTTSMSGGTWQYDVDIVDNTNNELVDTLLKGNFIVRAEITK